MFSEVPKHPPAPTKKRRKSSTSFEFVDVPPCAKRRRQQEVPADPLCLDNETGIAKKKEATRPEQNRRKSRTASFEVIEARPPEIKPDRLVKACSSSAAARIKQRDLAKNAAAHLAQLAAGIPRREKKEEHSNREAATAALKLAKFAANSPSPEKKRRPAANRSPSPIPAKKRNRRERKGSTRSHRGRSEKHSLNRDITGTDPAKIDRKISDPTVLQNRGAEHAAMKFAHLASSPIRGGKSPQNHSKRKERTTTAEDIAKSLAARAAIQRTKEKPDQKMKRDRLKREGSLPPECTTKLSPRSSSCMSVHQASPKKGEEKTPRRSGKSRRF